MAAWIEHGLLPALSFSATGAAVVVSIWGRTVDAFARAAAMLRAVPSADRRCVVAVEVNVSCPNVEDRSRMFAHSATATARSGRRSRVRPAPVGQAPVPTSAATSARIAAGALGSGAEGLTLVNTLLGLAIDVGRRKPALGAGGGGLSGPALHPVAVRAVWECREAFPDAGIVGVGGVLTGRDALELLLAGADAIQVGTATFRDPRAPWKIRDWLARWCRREGVGTVRDLVGAAHDG